MKRSLWLAAVIASWLLGHSAEAARPPVPWPPKQAQLRVIIDADAANEIDDQYALALALGSLDRFKIEGLVAAHYGDYGGSRGIDRSFEEMNSVLDKAGMAKKFPILRGADPIRYIDQTASSEGVDFIIEQAKSATPDEPLWLVLLGPATDAVVALQKEPKIADRLIVFWHGRSGWPNECLNFNAVNDAKAARLLFELPCRFVLFDTGTHLTISPQDSETRLAPLGPLGAYLHEIRNRKPEFMSPTKGIFDLGDIAALLDPDCASFERVQCPRVRFDMRYDFSKTTGEIVRIRDVNRDRSFELLEKALQKLTSSEQLK